MNPGWSQQFQALSALLVLHSQWNVDQGKLAAETSGGKLKAFLSWSDDC